MSRTNFEVAMETTEDAGTDKEATEHPKVSTDDRSNLV